MAAVRQRPSPEDSAAGELLAAARFAVPSLSRYHVHRPSLTARLDAAASPLVLVSAPAGTGKTALVVEWLEAQRGKDAEGGRFGWVSFDDGELSFWAQLVGCLARQGLPVEGLGRGVVGDGLLGRRRLAVLANAVLAERVRLTVVVDGYEMTSVELADEVEYLVDHTLGRLRLVFVGRVDPVLRLYRYRLREDVVEVRADDLAFGDHEAAHLLAKHGVTPEAEAVHELNQRVRGWLTGLRFAARALCGNPQPGEAVSTVVAQAGDINEYLLREVLDRQPPEVREFLLGASVPPIISADLVRELDGPPAVRVLEELARAPVFVEPVDEGRQVFRIYPFFRDLLRARLAYEDPSRLEALHRRTAAWFERHGQVDAAIAHLVEAGAWDEAAARLVDPELVARALLEGEDGPLVALAGRMPGDLDSGTAAVLRAALALVAGDHRAASCELVAAHAATASVADPRRLLLSATVLESVLTTVTEPSDDALAVTDEARVLVASTHRETGGHVDDVTALVELTRGALLLRAGALTDARVSLEVAAGGRTAEAHPVFRAETLGRLALLEVLEGHVLEARLAAEEAVAAGPVGGLLHPAPALAARVAIARAALDGDDLEGARTALAAATATYGVTRDPVCSVLTGSVAAALDAAEGRFDQGLARLDNAASRLHPADTWLADLLRVEAGRLCVAHGEPRRALQILDEVDTPALPRVAVVTAAAMGELGDWRAAEQSLARASSAEAPSTRVPALLVAALREAGRGRRAKSRLALQQSLRIAESEGLRRPLREAGPAVRRLLASSLLESQVRGPDLARSGNRNGAGAGLPDLGTGLVEPLTAKEQEVLGHLDELLTTEEIAAKMFVSVNTVRTHVRSILRKLGVTRRNAAVRRARELGLIGV